MSNHRARISWKQNQAMCLFYFILNNNKNIINLINYIKYLNKLKNLEKKQHNLKKYRIEDHLKQIVLNNQCIFSSFHPLQNLFI